MRQFNQVFFFSQDKFVCDAYSKALKSQGCECFCLNDFQPIDYYLEDMKPQAIIIDQKNYSDFLAELDEHLNGLKINTPVFILLENQEEKKMSVEADVLMKPINPFEVTSMINEKLDERS